MRCYPLRFCFIQILYTSIANHSHLSPFADLPDTYASPCPFSTISSEWRALLYAQTRMNLCLQFIKANFKQNFTFVITIKKQPSCTFMHIRLKTTSLNPPKCLYRPFIRFYIPFDYYHITTFMSRSNRSLVLMWTYAYIFKIRLSIIDLSSTSSIYIYICVCVCDQNDTHMSWFIKTVWP